MGVHSAKAMIVIAAEKKLGHAATRLALHIALQTLDFEGDSGEPPNTFWGGRDSLALGLGHLVMEYDREEDGQRARKAVYASVTRALAELTNAGVLQLLKAGSGRHRSMYRLVVPPPPSRASPRARVDALERELVGPRSP